MQLKDFRVLARRIFDREGCTDIPIRYDHGTYRAGEARYAGVRGSPDTCALFCLEFVRGMDIDHAVTVIYHELAHLKDKTHISNVQSPEYWNKIYRHEITHDPHGESWKREMLKMGQRPRAFFDDFMMGLQLKIDAANWTHT